MRRKWSLLLGLVLGVTAAGTAGAQNRTITGRIIDNESKAGISGAVINVVGHPQATQAGADGNFRLNVTVGDLTLTVRALGYGRVIQKVPASESNVTIGMTREALQLNEVVVTGAATTQERRNVATAVSTVSAQTVAQVPAVSLDNALQGKVVGATIDMNSGAPGGGGQMQIRGVTSILGNGQPLFVVDGVIISNVSLSSGINAVTRAAGNAATSNQDNAVNRLADINPDEIENIQVLKSAAATAIYGSQATNGVVIITTKRGQSGSTRLHASQKFGQYRPARLLGSRHFTQQEYYDAIGDSASMLQYCPGTSTSACPYYDYQGAIYGQKSLAYESEASLSGGSDQTKYYGTVSDKYDPGTQINTGARRQNLRLNLDQALGEKITTNLSAGLYRSITSRGISNNDNSFVSPFYGLAYTPAVVNLQQKDASGHYIDNPILPIIFAQGSNPFQTLQGLKSQEDVWRQIGSGSIKYAAYSSERQTFTLQANGGFDAFAQSGETYSPPYMEYERYDYPATPGSTVEAQGNSKQVNGTLSAVHTWTPSEGLFSRISSATTSAGLQYDQRYLNSFVILARGLIPGLQDVTQGSPSLTQTKTDVRDQAMFLNEELLALNERLSVSGRVRAERSSVNGDATKFYYYPAWAASYRFEDLLPHVNELKLRAAIGTSGNQPTYGQRDIAVAPTGVIAGTNALGAPFTVGNPNIKPETMRELEYGVDGSFFDQRIGLESSVFSRDITDLLLQAPLAQSTGYGAQFINGGHMQTKGLELGLNLLPVRNPSFTWTSHVSYYSFTSTMISMPVPNFVLGSSGFGASYGHGRIGPGYKTTLIWGNKINALGKTVDTVLADANPQFQMSFSNDFQFGSFDVSGLVDWKKGGFMSDMTQNLMDEGLNSWDYDKPSPDPKYKSLGQYRYDSWNGGRNTAPYIQDGSYVKLREITVNYRIPQSVSGRVLGGHDARLSVSGRNLYTWTPYWSFDPEVNNFGAQNVVRFVDLAPYPTSRSFFAGVDVSW